MSLLTDTTGTIGGPSDGTSVTVLICAYTERRWDDVLLAVDSVYDGVPGGPISYVPAEIFGRRVEPGGLAVMSRRVEIVDHNDLVAKLDELLLCCHRRQHRF